MALAALGPGDPATIGPYSLRGRLGSGGMGVVYLGFDDAGAPAALKTLPHGVSGDVRRRLRREAELLQAVDSDRIARFIAADTDADRPWIAMAYVAGPSLNEVTLPLSPIALRQLADGLATALTRLHAVGMTHRDVKPGNVILTFDGPVLVDLGIAQVSDSTSLTAEGTMIGTPAWMAPEQLAGKPAGSATDVWGWASVIYYAATGRAPFGDGAVPALAYRIQHVDPDLDAVPTSLRTSLVGAFAKDPAERPLAANLAVVTATVDSPLAPAPAPAPAQRHEMDTVHSLPASEVGTRSEPRLRRPLVIAAACVLVLLIGGGGAIYAANSGNSKSNSTAASGDPGSIRPSGIPSSRDSRSSTSNGSPSVPITSSPTSTEWPSAGTVQEARAVAFQPPAFPSAVTGYSLERSWSTELRAFDETTDPSGWSTIYQFPATMNGCADQRFYIRWRTLNPATTVKATFVSVPDEIVTSRVVSGGSGWMSGFGCGQPGFQLASTTDDSTLTDIAVSIKQWKVGG